MRRVRNACKQGDDLVALTRIALEEVGNTRGFKHAGEVERSVQGEVDGKRIGYGTWRAWFTLEDTVRIYITTKTGCEHLWSFNWPNLQMISYKLMTCSCDKDADRRRQRQ